MISVWKLNWREAAPRILADYVGVQLAGVLSLIVAAAVHIRGNGEITADAVALMLRTYYTDTFLPLSLIFPVAFLLSGFYSTSRHYSRRYKWQSLLRGSVLASLVYLFASFMLTRYGTLPRSAMLAFVFMVTTGTVASRWFKDWIVPDEGTRTQQRAVASAGEGTILVVGGAGYIGSILVRKLLAAGKRVRILDSLVYGHGALGDVLDHPNCELMVGDCRNIQSVVGAVKGVSSIVHLAAIVGDPACEQDRQSALEINYAATRMLIEVAKGQRVGRLIFASSCSVYGASDLLMDERSDAKPISLYAQTKVDSERALLEAETESFHPTVLRFATVFGNSPRPRFDLVVNLLTAKAHQEGVITIFNGEQWRPFLHVDDVARAIKEVLDAPAAIVSGEIFNVGDSRLNYRLTDVAERIRRFFPATVVENVENSDRRNYRVNFDKFRNVIGFKASRDLDDGIRELKLAFEQGRIADYSDPLYHNQRFLEKAGSPSNMNQVDTFVMAAFSRSLSALDDGMRSDAALSLETMEPKPL